MSGRRGQAALIFGWTAIAAGAVRLPGRVEVCLYRLTQEVLSNVIRHAGASRASVVVIRHAGSVTLLVEDNGRGFDLESTIARWDGRMGLTGMREREVCGLLALGHANAEIGEQLAICERTVETHRANIMRKLELKTRAELVRFAIDNGLVRL